MFRHQVERVGIEDQRRVDFGNQVFDQASGRGVPTDAGTNDPSRRAGETADDGAEGGVTGDPGRNFGNRSDDDFRAFFGQDGVDRLGNHQADDPRAGSSRAHARQVCRARIALRARKDDHRTERSLVAISGSLWEPEAVGSRQLPPPLG